MYTEIDLYRDSLISEKTWVFFLLAVNSFSLTVGCALGIFTNLFFIYLFCNQMKLIK